MTIRTLKECAWRTGSTNAEGKGELPMACQRKGCLGRFIKEPLLDCYIPSPANRDDFERWKEGLKC